MKHMKISTTCLSVATLLLATGCTALDFFGLEDNAPIHMVEKPEGYTSSRFGSEITSTAFNYGDDSFDLIAVSAGSRYPTIIYRVAKNGKLTNVEDPWSEYLMNKKTEAKDIGSGTSLVGLSTWIDDGEFVSGCVAIGEPLASNVHIKCEQDSLDLDMGGEIIGTDQDFGFSMAGILPISSGSWLLAVAARDRFAVFSSVDGDDHTIAATPTDDIGDPVLISNIAAGRLQSSETFFVAAASPDSDSVSTRFHLFVQDNPGSRNLTQVACISSTEVGFGGVMTTGDLNGDGDDELIVSGSNDTGRSNAVHIFEIEDLLSTTPACSDTTTPLATITPDFKSCKEDSSCGFGASLAVGDLATDDNTQELVIGAPGAKPDGESNAGSVFVYRGVDVMAGGNPEPAGKVSDSYPQKGHKFGGGVAVAPMAGRNELVVGAVGEGNLFLVYCTGVGEDLSEGADVTTNNGGKVISTRCRPK